MQLTTSTNIYFERHHEPFISMKESIEKCANAGYRGLDFGFAELSLASERLRQEDWLEELAEYKILAEKLGVMFVQAHATIWDFCKDDGAMDEKKLLFERSIIGAGYLGAEWLVVHPSDGGLDTHKRNVEFFRYYAEFAEKYKVKLAIENMWGKTRSGNAKYCVAPEELLRLVEDVHRDNVKVCWDVEHGSIEKLNQREAIGLLKDYIVTTHISDEAGPDSIHILPYLGKADWAEILGALAEIDYRGNFNFEIQHYLPGVPKELVPAAMRLSYEVGSYMVNQLMEMKRRTHVSVSAQTF